MKSVLLSVLALSLTQGAVADSATAGNQLFNLAGVPAKERTRVESDFWPANPGEAAVCMWKDDKLGAISFTIDDNCAMNVDWWLEQAAKYEVPLTWFLITGGVGGDNRPHLVGTWELWRRAREAGHAIESHTVTHLGGAANPDWKGIDWEYAESKTQIEAGIPGHKVGFLAYPGGGNSSKNDPAVAAKHYLAARGTRAVSNAPNGIDYMSVNAMSKSSVSGDGWSNLNNVLDKNLYRGSQYGGWSVVLYHYVKPPYEDPLEKLEFYAANKDRLWAGTFGDVARYGQQRETSTLKVKESSAQRIVLELKDRMDDRYYDLPLTVKVRLPAGWSKVAAQQAGNIAVARVVERDGAHFALVDVVPDRGEAVLEKKQ